MQHDYNMLTRYNNNNDGFTTAERSTNFGIRQVGKAPPPQSARRIGRQPVRMGPCDSSDGQAGPTFSSRIWTGHKVITHVFWAIGEGAPAEI